LSLFPGIDLLGRAFELEGFCVVRGPDPAIGTGDVRTFHAPKRFEGIIGGSPCQDFSRARRSPSTGHSLEMIREFVRIVHEAEPHWWLLENVPTVPDVNIEGYTHQRIDLNAREFGLAQNRPRHFQFGSLWNQVLCVQRASLDPRQIERCCIASEGTRQNRRGWDTFCALQGLPEDFQLPYFTQAGRYRAVGNGVPIPMGRAVANAIQFDLHDPRNITVCACGCGRQVTGKQQTAGMACRQRVSRRRRRVTPAESHAAATSH
jgi:DNA (cytosine-5)-methyltransferase 1